MHTANGHSGASVYTSEVRLSMSGHELCLSLREMPMKLCREYFNLWIMTPALEAGHRRHEFWHPFIGEEMMNIHQSDRKNG